MFAIEAEKELPLENIDAFEISDSEDAIVRYPLVPVSYTHLTLPTICSV